MDKKEAIKILRELHDKVLFSERTALEILHPEFKESEDEKIRKELIEHVKDQQSSFISAPDCRDKYEEEENNKYNSWLTWLEKQGKVVNEICKENDDSLTNEDEKIRKALIEYFNEQCDMSDWNGVYGYQVVVWLEKQGVQKPADKSEPKFKVKYAGREYNVLEIKENMGITWYGIEDEPNHIDYVKANSCEIISGYAIKENGSPYPTKPAIFAGHNPTEEDMKEALRTEYEKGRADAFVQMQKGWSEKDEKMLNSIIEDFGDGKTSNMLQEYWLKSLKQRYTWKPSDAQMEALNDVISSRDIKYDVLSELWEDLKKLKGE